MKRLTLLLLGLALGVTATANAQGLTMQMSNGWAFSFSGNVNAFWVFSKATQGGPTNSSVRTGLLPSFATFEARGKEAGMNLAVHFGFAPQIQNGNITAGAGAVHDQFGAQIDMRQVYLTFGGQWGQILAGRELALFGRQNILNDQTLFGVGAVGVGGGGGGGTTLGRIGYGYLYPNFNAQVTYSTRPGTPAQLSIGLFQPSAIVGTNYNYTKIPRLEAELTWSQRSGKSKYTAWAGGLWQSSSTAPDTGGISLSSFGGTVGVRGDFQELSVVVTGYISKGLGNLLEFNSAGGGSPVATNDSTGRPGDGGYVQLGYTFNKKTTLAGSFGFSRLKNASSGEGAAANNSLVRTQWTSYTVGIYHQWTKSMKLVFEGTHEQAGIGGASPAQTDVSAGFMLFF
jgi:hypothetical protein